jgi:hypothetical protein
MLLTRNARDAGGISVRGAGVVVVHIEGGVSEPVVGIHAIIPPLPVLKFEWSHGDVFP